MQVQEVAIALSEVGLSSIPVTTTIANIISKSAAKEFISKLEGNWQSARGKKFIFTNKFYLDSGLDSG